MSNPTFSVVIPAYNAAATLRDTVESVLAQTFSDFEIFIVDDGSSDTTVREALRLSSEDRRVRVVSQPNGGVSAARNFGAQLTKGRFLAFLDADDQWAADKLERHDALHKADATVNASFAGVEFCADVQGALEAGPTASTVPNADLDISDVVVENPVCTASNFVISREFYEELGGFDETLRYAEDQEILALLIAEGGTLRGIDAPLVRYRLSEDGLSCDFQAMLDGWRSFASSWLSERALAQAEATYCRYLARRALRSGANMAVARSFACRGLKADSAGFLAGGARSLLTLGGVIAGGAMPASLRRTVFA
ncbi:MAG: glycosyltransferase family A protein [Pseudomonadota bacterium]